MCILEYYKGQPCIIEDRDCEKCPKYLRLKENIIKIIKGGNKYDNILYVR